MYNLTLLNASNPQILVKSTSDVFFNGMMEEIILLFLFLLLYMAFYFSSEKSQKKAIVYSTFAILILSIFFLGLEWITGKTFFIALCIYAVALFIAYNMPE